MTRRAIMKQFETVLVPHVHFGNGMINKISEIVSSICDNHREIMLITDKNIFSSRLPHPIIFKLQNDGFKVEILDSIPPEPTNHELDDLAKKLRSVPVSAIIGIGGGSVMDSSKILSILAKYSVTTADLSQHSVPGKGLPFILIPTTSGTGAETTPNAIVLFPERQLKIGIVSPFFIPEHVILDPELTLGLPPSLTASTGIDTVCHLLESFLAKKANSFSDMFALEGLKLMVNSLPIAFQDGKDLEARSSAMLSAFYGGICISAAGTNAVHALSYPLGGMFKIPHGLANSILLIPVIEYEKDRIFSRLAMTAEVLGCSTGLGEYEDASSVVERLNSLIRYLQIPTNLQQFGVKPSALDYLVDAAYEIRRLLDNNPIKLNKNDIRAIYAKVI